MKVAHELNDMWSGTDFFFFKYMNFIHFTCIIFSFLNRIEMIPSPPNVLLNGKDEESSDDTDRWQSSLI